MRRFTILEIALVGSFIFMIAGAIFAWSKSNTLNSYSKEIIKTKQQIKEIINYKKSWDQKGIDKRVNRLRFLVSSNVKDWRVSRKKAYIKINSVEIKALNRFLVKLSSLPIQFITLDINSKDDKYYMECRCKW